MRVSIIVPARNEAEGIAATIAPLQPLRAQGHEIIVVDGESDDGTGRVAAPFADRVLHGPMGRARQMNAGAAIASGDILVFLHADTLIAPEAVVQLPAALAGDAWQWGRFDVRIDGDSRWLAVIAWAMNLRSRVTGIATGDQALFVRRAAFARAGGFPEQPLMEDVALSRTLKRVAGRPLCLRRRVTTSGRRWREHGVARTVLRMWSLRLRYWCGADPGKLAALYPAHRRTRRPCVVQIFAKAPVAGRVKTRLVPAIGAAQAAEIHASLVAQTLAVATGARDDGTVDAVELWCDDNVPATSEWLGGFDEPLRVQHGADVGERMAYALDDALRRGYRPLLVGSDCPVLERTHFRAAREALDTQDAVFLPAEDGGYALVGLTRPLDIFADVPWSTAEVMDVTRKRLRALGATWRELDPVWDVDRPEDLARWHACG